MKRFKQAVTWQRPFLHDQDHDTRTTTLVFLCRIPRYISNWKRSTLLLRFILLACPAFLTVCNPVLQIPILHFRVLHFLVPQFLVLHFPAWTFGPSFFRPYICRHFINLGPQFRVMYFRSPGQMPVRWLKLETSVCRRSTQLQRARQRLRQTGDLCPQSHLRRIRLTPLWRRLRRQPSIADVSVSCAVSVYFCI